MELKIKDASFMFVENLYTQCSMQQRAFKLISNTLVRLLIVNQQFGISIDARQHQAFSAVSEVVSLLDCTVCYTTSSCIVLFIGIPQCR